MCKEKLNNKKILITGGAGFIGSNLCEYFLELEAKVVCLDNFSTGNYQNISHLISNKNFLLVEGDIRNLKFCQKSCQEVDYVLHQAALGSVPRSIKNPILTNDVNINGFLNMLVAARDNKVKRFVFAASSSTYGNSKDLPKHENLIGKPLSPYAITKNVNELYAEIFSKLYGLNYIGLRYFNVFGKRQDPNGNYAAVIPVFINKLINYKSPVINGDGSFSRDFTHIDNIILLNSLAVTTEKKEALNNIYNGATGLQTSLNELFTIIKKILSKKDNHVSNINVKYGPNRNGDIPHSLASIEKAKNLLNYKPNTDLQKSFEKTITWFWNNKK